MLVLSSITELNFNIIIPFGAGCVIGLLAFSHFLNWLFKTFRDGTIALLTGFIAGSLLIIWPWKEEVHHLTAVDRHGDPLLLGYKWLMPASFSMETIIAIVLIIIGIVSVWGIEKMGENKQ